MNKLNNKGFAISTIIYGTLILFVVLMTVLMFTLQFRYRNLSNSNLVSNSGSIENTDTTGKPNPPDLSTDLIPIKYVGEHWEVTTADDPNWYDYGQQEWANAASLKSTEKKIPGTELDIENDVYAMFVWIPRYSYTIGCTSPSSCYGYKVDTDKTSELSFTTPGAIDIKFVSKDTPKEEYQNSETVLKAPTYIYSTGDTEEQRIAKREEASNWYTHPAFTFGDKELSGLWVGKFETSTATDASCYNSTSNNCSVGETEIRILPNVKSQRYQQISNQFKYAQYLTKNETYGLTGDAHMMKNSEWGAVAYLAQSIYGKYGNPNYEGANKEIYINNSSDMYTGRSGGTTYSDYNSDGKVQYDDILVADPETKIDYTGTGASTTGNIYGIYDMNGGAFEYVMGYYNNTTEYSGFDQKWLDDETNKKYFDKYEDDMLFEVNDKASIGGAIKETNSWYSDRNVNEYGNYWLLRGGMFSLEKEAGIFAWQTYNGNGFGAFSFRTSLISTN